MGMESAEDHPMDGSSLENTDQVLQALIFCLACGEPISSTERRLEVELFFSREKWNMLQRHLAEENGEMGPESASFPPTTADAPWTLPCSQSSSFPPPC